MKDVPSQQLIFNLHAYLQCKVITATQSFIFRRCCCLINHWAGKWRSSERNFWDLVFLFLPFHYIVTSHVSNANNKLLLETLSFLDHFSIMTTQTIQLLYTQLILPEIWVTVAATPARSVVNGGKIVSGNKCDLYRWSNDFKSNLE